jgi:hypothetical protein
MIKLAEPISDPTDDFAIPLGMCGSTENSKRRELKFHEIN